MYGINMSIKKILFIGCEWAIILNHQRQSNKSKTPTHTTFKHRPIDLLKI